jgi:hypothetical protein
MRAIVVIFAICVAFLVLKVVEVAGRIDHRPALPIAIAPDQELSPAVERLNAEFRKQWDAERRPPCNLRR